MSRVIVLVWDSLSWTQLSSHGWLASPQRL